MPRENSLEQSGLSDAELTNRRRQLITVGFTGKMLTKLAQNRPGLCTAEEANTALSVLTEGGKDPEGDRIIALWHIADHPDHYLGIPADQLRKRLEEDGEKVMKQIFGSH